MFEVNGSVSYKEAQCVKAPTYQLAVFWDCKESTDQNETMQTKLRLEQTLHSNGQLFCHVTLTLWWGEEVEKGVIGDRFGDRPDRAAALVLLFLFDCFQCDVLALRPLNRAAVVKNKEQWKQGQEAAFEVSNLQNIWDELSSKDFQLSSGSLVGEQPVW